MSARRFRKFTRVSIISLPLLLLFVYGTACSSMIAMENGSREPETEPLVYAGVRHHIMEADHTNECTRYFWQIDLVGSLAVDTLLLPWTAAWALHIALAEDDYGDDGDDVSEDSEQEDERQREGVRPAPASAD